MLYGLSNLASPPKEQGAGGDEPKLGLVDPFDARICRPRTLSVNEGEGDGPTGIDGDESVCGRSTSSIVMLGLPKTARNGAPAPGHAATLTRGARINISCLVNFSFCLEFQCWVSVMMSLV